MSGAEQLGAGGATKQKEIYTYAAPWQVFSMGEASAVIYSW
jgi:hypothetical protein